MMPDVQNGSDKIKDLSLFYQPTLLRNLLGIIAVSLIMTWVEIAILRILFLPQINASIVNKAREEGARLNNENNEGYTKLTELSPFFQAFDVNTAATNAGISSARSKYRAAISALEKEEARTIKTYNNFVTFITLVPWLTISFIAYVLYWRLSKDKVTLSSLIKEGKVEVFGFQIRATILSTLAGLLLFGFLQYSFYQMTLKWKLPEIDDLLYLSNRNIEQKVCS